MDLLPAVLIGGFLLFLLVYWKFIDEPTKEAKKRLKKWHFHLPSFIHDMKQATFEYYDEKLKRLVIIFCIASPVAIAVPGFTLPFPISGIIAIMGVALAALLVAYYQKELNTQEIEEAGGTEFGQMFAYCGPKHGFVSLTLRRMQYKGTVTLTDEQCNHALAGALKTIKTMPEFTRDIPQEEQEDFLTLVEEQMRQRIQQAKGLRIDVGDYKLLIVSDSDYEDLKTSHKQRMIDRTIEVKVQLVPTFSIYADNTTRIFEDLEMVERFTGDRDDKGVKKVSRSKVPSKAYKSASMGIFIDIVNLSTIKKAITKGKFDTPDHLTAFMGQFMHVVEQRQWSDTSMTAEVRKREDAQLELETLKFEAAADVNDFVTTVTTILKLIAAILQRKSIDKYDSITLVLGLAVGMGLMYVLMLFAGWRPPI